MKISTSKQVDHSFTGTGSKFAAGKGAHFDPCVSWPEAAAVYTLMVNTGEFLRGRAMDRRNINVT